MEPYQLKLISLYQKTKEDESKLSKKITVEEAIEQLHFKMKTSLVDDVERKVNVFLMENLEQIKKAEEKETGQEATGGVTVDEKDFVLQDEASDLKLVSRGSFKKKSTLNNKDDFFVDKNNAKMHA